MHDRFAIARIEISGRFVCQQNGWPAGKRPGDGHALLLAAGELTRQVFCPMSHAHALQASVTSDLRSSRRCRDRSAATHVLKNREVADQIKALKNETDFAIANTRPFGERKIRDFVTF